MESTTYISSVEFITKSDCVIKITETTDIFETLDDGSISILNRSKNIKMITYGNDISSLSPGLQKLINTFFEISFEL